jgi:hypothetical protein
MAAKFSLGLLYDQATVQTPAWGSGRTGLQKRAEWRGLGLVSRGLTEYTVASLRGTDPIYARCACKGFGPRSRHAVVAEFLERRRDGSFRAPVSRFAGIGAGVGVTSLGQGADATGAPGRIALLAGTDLGFNMLQEFWPEIKRTLLLRKKVIRL